MGTYNKLEMVMSQEKKSGYVRVNLFSNVAACFN